MDCIIVAGGVPEPDDPLYAYTQGKPKALLEINGRFLVDYVLAAMQDAQSVETIVLVGLNQEQVGQLASKGMVGLPDQGGLLNNILYGIDWLHENRGLNGPVLLSSSDIPALTPAIVEHFIEQCQPFNHSVYYNFVTRSVLERRYPGSNRTYVKLKGLEIAGGDMHIAQSELGKSHAELWETMINGRKHAWKLARIVGWPTLLKLLTRQLTLHDIEHLTGRILGKNGKIMLNPHAEIAMDIDKVNQLELLTKEMKQNGP